MITPERRLAAAREILEGLSFSLSLPLAGFAAAYDGPAQTLAMPLFEAQPGLLEKELRAQQEPQKRTEADRNALCEGQ